MMAPHSRKGRRSSDAAREPEVCDLARLCAQWAPTSRGEPTRSRSRGAFLRGPDEVMADRIEAATLLLAGAITGGT